MPRLSNGQKRSSASSTTDVSQPEKKIPKCSTEAPQLNNSIHSEYETVLDTIRQGFYLRCPQEFVDFYRFCCSINKTSPLSRSHFCVERLPFPVTTTDALADALGLTLVGPFEVLHSRHDQGTSAARPGEFALCHRFFHDPPELVTILIGSSDDYHIGYYRYGFLSTRFYSLLFSDCPQESASLLVESDPMKTGSLKILGDSIFAVIQ